MTSLVVVFDVGSTLIHPDFAVLQNWVARRAGTQATISAIEYAFRRAIAGDMFSGENDSAAQAQRFFRLCGCQENDAEAWSSWWEDIVQCGAAGSWLYTSLDADALAALKFLRSSNCRLVAASNSNGTLREELAQFELLELFEATFDSADLGFEKPAPEFYERVLSSSPRGCSFVHVGDDFVKDVIGPIAAGFQRAVLYDPARIHLGLPQSTKIQRLSELGRSFGITS